MTTVIIWMIISIVAYLIGGISIYCSWLEFYKKWNRVETDRRGFKWHIGVILILGWVFIIFYFWAAVRIYEIRRQMEIAERRLL
jgi:membrane protease YdiL (CAAX protease family)